MLLFCIAINNVQNLEYQLSKQASVNRHVDLFYKNKKQKFDIFTKHFFLTIIMYLTITYVLNVFFTFIGLFLY